VDQHKETGPFLGFGGPRKDQKGVVLF